MGSKCVCEEWVCVGSKCVCREGRCIGRVSVFFRHPEVGDRERVCGVEWDQHVVSFPTLPNTQF